MGGLVYYLLVGGVCGLAFLTGSWVLVGPAVMVCLGFLLGSCLGLARFILVMSPTPARLGVVCGLGGGLVLGLLVGL